MKRRINELLNGIYEYDMPAVEFSLPSINGSVRRGETFAGSFYIKNTDQKKMRGFLYSSDARVACSPTEFSGIEPRISFDVDFCGMKEGDTLSGEITVCTNMGEASLPYTFSMVKGRMRQEREVPESLAAFTKIAMEDYERAYGIFSSEAFDKLIYEKEQSYGALYEAIQCRDMEYSRMEEFLIGAGQKKPLYLSMPETEAQFEDINQIVKESFQIHKEEWGFCRMEVSSDAAFLEPERTLLTTDDFVGSILNLPYLLHPEKMHAGKNFGRITVKTELQTLQFQVMARKQCKLPSEHSLHAQRRQIAEIYRTYIDFRMKKININTWISRSEEIYEAYEKAGGRDVIMKLYRAQLYFAADLPEKACEILEELEEKRGTRQKPEVKGYQQYLTTFYHKDTGYVDYVEETIRDLYIQNQENWILQWILLYLREDYLKQPSQKLEAIREQFLYGCRSRIMYVEAWYVLEQTPMLLKKLDDFEIQILRFICKEDLLTQDIIMQIADLAVRCRVYSKELYQILCCCYTKYDSKSVLNAICSLLMKGHKAGPEYFNWYEKGVAKELRLTGLYEYYVESMGRERTGILPQMVRMYFAYHNTLGYEKKAIVYANVIKNKEKDPQTYETYRPTMEKFMLDQLEEGRMNRELASIYRTFLNRSFMNSVLAKRLAKAMFTCEIQCDSKEAVSVAVIHRQLRDIQRVTLVSGVANVQIYSEDAQILIIDKGGHLHAGSLPFTLTWLMRDERLYGLCRELAPDSPGFLLWFCCEAQRTKQMNEENIREFCRLLEYEDVKESYKMQIRQEVLNYYAKNPKADSLFAYLHKMDLEGYICTDKDKTIQLLVSEGMCQEAFEFISKYGPEKVDYGALTRMCSHCILENGQEEDEMLLYLSAYCFRNDKYDETTLSYLLEYYDGPVEQMKAIWTAGRKFELDTFLMEEKILIILLFTRTGMEGTEEIFESYRRKLGKKMLLQAYVNLMSYEYFVKLREVETPVFEYIRRGMEKGKYQELSTTLALLLYESKHKLQDAEHEKNLVELLSRCTSKGLKFAFFEDLEGDAARLLQLSDRRFVEYRTNPEAVVFVKYYLESAEGVQSLERSEQMQNMYEGIFEKEFTLFADEELVYSIIEEYQDRTKESGPYRLKAKPAVTQKSLENASRYEMLNAMCLEWQDGKDTEMKKTAVSFVEKEQIIRQMCGLL